MNADDRVAAAIAQHGGPPVIYPATLADLVLFAEAAAELGANVSDAMPFQKALALALMCRIYEAVERIAGADHIEIFDAESAVTQLRRAGL
jgi:hypothetical protein